MTHDQAVARAIQLNHDFAASINGPRYGELTEDGRFWLRVQTTRMQECLDALLPTETIKRKEIAA